MQKNMVPFEIVPQFQACLRSRMFRRARPARGNDAARTCPADGLPADVACGDLLPQDALPDDPTPDEIRRACQEIQATWSDQERRLRANVRRPTDLDERVDSEPSSRV